MSSENVIKYSFNNHTTSNDTYKKPKDSIDDICYKDLVDEDGNQLDYNCVNVTQNAQHIKEELL